MGEFSPDRLVLVRVSGPARRQALRIGDTPIEGLLRWGDKSQDLKSIRVSLLYVTIV